MAPRGSTDDTRRIIRIGANRAGSEFGLDIALLRVSMTAPETRSITSSRRAFEELAHLAKLEVEEFWVLLLHSNKALMGKECVFRGTVDACPIFPRDVFRSACRFNATSIIVAHNHPSGDRYPSPSDLKVTKRLISGGKLLGIPLLDHLIIAGADYWSFADHGRLSEFAGHGRLPNGR